MKIKKGKTMKSLPSHITHLTEKYDFEKLIEVLKNHKIIMLGESTHGTHEFYKARIELTKELIKNHKITAITLEGDWPSVYKINKYVQGSSPKDTAFSSLSSIDQFPLWMWRNKDFLEFVIWLYEHNTQLEQKNRIGIFGLDLYSLHKSALEVIKYLEKVDPKESELAKQRYNCFDKFGFDMQNYGYLTTQNLAPDCQKEIVEQLVSLQEKSHEYLKDDGFVKQEELFCAEQNSIVVKNAETYYKSLFFGGSNISWNIRDSHMMNTLKFLYDHQKNQAKDPKIIVWAHNSHIGDCRATQFADDGQINIGQLAREYFGNKVFLLGFMTYQGTVSAASEWGAQVERKIVRPGISESYEKLFHELARPEQSRRADTDLLIFSDKLSELDPMLQRAIGVIYKPETERFSHYFLTDLKKQFNALIYYDYTIAVEPLEKTAEWEKGEMPATYPFGI